MSQVTATYTPAPEPPRPEGTVTLTMPLATACALMGLFGRCAYDAPTGALYDALNQMPQITARGFWNITTTPSYRT